MLFRTALKSERRRSCFRIDQLKVSRTNQPFSFKGGIIKLGLLDSPNSLLLLILFGYESLEGDFKPNIFVGHLPMFLVLNRLKVISNQTFIVGGGAPPAPPPLKSAFRPPRNVRGAPTRHHPKINPIISETTNKIIITKSQRKSIK